MARAAVGYRFALWWSHYTRGVRERYRLLMTPAHPGFFLPWLGYALFIAATLRWLIDVILLLVLLGRGCDTPSIARLEHETTWIPMIMLLGIGLMAVTLLPKQKGYVRVIPLWIGEAVITLLPVSFVLAIVGLSFFWFDLRYACR